MLLLSWVATNTVMGSRVRLLEMVLDCLLTRPLTDLFLEASSVVLNTRFLLIRARPAVLNLVSSCCRRTMIGLTVLTQKPVYVDLRCQRLST